MSSMMRFSSKVLGRVDRGNAHRAQAGGVVVGDDAADDERHMAKPSLRASAPASR
jgi:hypothetical protein